MNDDGFYFNETMCRTCLRRDAEKEIFSVHKPTTLKFSSMLNSCVGDLSQVKPDDGLPKNICLKCLKLLVSFYKFKNLVLQNDNKLRSALKETQTVQLQNQNIIQIVDKINFQQQLIIVPANTIPDSQIIVDNINVQYINNDTNYTREQESDNVNEITARDICIVTDSESSDLDESELEKTDISNKSSETFQCEICGNILSSKGNLNKHIRSHTGERPYSCDICNKKFFKAEHVLMHKRIHTGERPHKCLICSKRFIQYAALKNHLKTHSGERPHVCSSCGKSFAQTSNLVYHMRTHSGETPYMCQLCNKGFKNAGNLRVHMRFHGNVRNYICNICEKRFVTSSHLKVHLKQHNGERPHKCVVCGKGFVRSEHLKIHLVTHSGQKPFYCKLCPRRFTQNSHLKRHLKIHQKDTPLTQWNV